METSLIYSLLLGIGTSIGVWRVYRVLPIRFAVWGLVAAIITLIGAVIGARLGYVLIQRDVFRQQPAHMIQFWLGGLNGFGALLGALIFSIPLAIWLRERIFKFLDWVTLMLLPVGIAAWLGCWAVGTAYGHLLPAGTWYSLRVPDESGLLDSRFPLQLIAAVVLLLLLLLVENKLHFKQSGLHFAEIGLLFSLHSLIFNLLRADSSPQILGYRLDVVLSAALTILFLSTTIILFLFSRKGHKIDVTLSTREVEA